MPLNPRCPKCSSEMQLRTARRGNNAGNQFYGCSRYPGCKGTLSINDLGGANTEEVQFSPTESDKKFMVPQIMVARSKYRSHQVCFIESIATAFATLESLQLGDISDQELKAISQWRIDFLRIEGPSKLTERSKQILSVCEKILTRGRITLSSPYVEKEAMLLLGIDNYFITDDIDINHFIREQIVPEEYWFDSKAEEIFYYDVLKGVFNDYVQWVTPQVEISSLLPKGAGVDLRGRVDFLLYHPSIKKPIIIEIDGKQHCKSKDTDYKRDDFLQRYGYIVKRYKAEDVELDPENIIEDLKDYLKDYQGAYLTDNNYKFIQALKIIHQIQVTIIKAVRYGFLTLEQGSTWNINIRHESINIFESDQVDSICKIAISDLMQILGHLGNLYSFPLNMNVPALVTHGNYSYGRNDSITISFDSEMTEDQNTFTIQDICVPFHIANEGTPANAAILDTPDEEALLYFLNYVFRKDSFWEGQLDAIIRAFGCKDAILLLPTGGGKSIAFQLASLLLPGRTIVIEPIISLIMDQIDNLTTYGIDRCISITSLIHDPIERDAVLNMFSQGEYLLLYIAPERMQTIEFRGALRSLTVHNPINIIVVDEAHCVSEWGHDFRTAYLNIGRISRDYCEAHGIIPALIALTGTASRAVLKDIQRELQIEEFDAIITPRSFNRPELKFNIIPCKSSEKFPRLVGYLSRSLPDMFNVTRETLTQVNGKDTYSGLVFCPWANGEFGVVEVSRKIQNELSITNDYYSGKTPKHHGNNFSWATQKQSVTKSFKYNKTALLTCTKAFGMGIDKSNIRYTIHYGLPMSIEAFYQEAGRAGRDRRVAHCCILSSLDDPERDRRLLDPNTSVEEIAEVIRNINRPDNDDVTRALYFHVQSFKGIDTELTNIKGLLTGSFSDYAQKGYKDLNYDSEQRPDYEKYLHRLLLLGIIDDYTINYSAKTFTAKRTGASKENIIESFGKYISGYSVSRSQRLVEKANTYIPLGQLEFVLEMLKLLLDFIYSTIEKGRRRALSEICLTASGKTSDSTIRNRILRYLEATEHTQLIDELLEEPNAGIEKVISILDNILSPNEAAEIRGQISRYLESYPDYPSLLMLRALTEIYCKDRDFEVVKQNFFASVSSAHMNYKIDEAKLHLFIARSIIRIDKKNHDLSAEITENIIMKFRKLDFSKTMVNELPDDLAEIPALHILADLNNKCLQLLTM